MRNLSENASFMHISPLNSISYKGYSKPQNAEPTVHKKSVAKKAEAMLLASMISLAALGNCDIESTSSNTKNVNLAEKDDKTEQLLDYQDEYEKHSQVIYSSVYGRIRSGDTSKGYKKMSTLAHTFSTIIFEKSLKISPYISIGQIYKYDLEKGTPVSYLLDSKDQGDATFNRVTAIGVKAEYLGFYVKTSSTELYSSYNEQRMFSHVGAVGYKYNVTDKLALDVAFNNDFTNGKGASDGREYNRSVEGGVVYKISDNANIKLGIQNTIKHDGEPDIDYSASFFTTF